MKKALIAFAIIFSLHTIEAQILNNLSIELDVGRLAEQPGVFSPGNYEKKLSFINGFGLGYDLSDKLTVYTGIRKFHSSIMNKGFEVFEEAEVSGSEFKLGAELAIRKSRPVYFGVGLEYFRETSRQKGEYWDDALSYYELNHDRTYAGLGLKPTIYWRLTDKVSFYLNTRFRYGKLKFSQTESTRSDIVLYPEYEKNSTIWDPINSFGFRVDL